MNEVANFLPGDDNIGEVLDPNMPSFNIVAKF